MKRWKEFRFEYLRTAAVFLLLCAMACTLIWALPAQVHADYTEPYMKRMEELGLLQGDADGDLRPGDPITRAEFVTIINRAFGYRSAGGHPFRDVPGHRMVCGRCRHRLYGGIYYGDLPYCLFPEPEHHPGGGGFHSGEEPDDGTGSGGEHQFCGRKKHQYMEPRNGLRGSGE